MNLSLRPCPRRASTALSSTTAGARSSGRRFAGLPVGLSAGLSIGLVLAAVEGRLAAVPPPVDAVILHVDSVAGEDSADRDGSPSEPFRTLNYAFGWAETLSSPEDPPSVCLEVRLRPGTYREEETVPGEGYPVRLPAGFRDVSIIGASIAGVPIIGEGAEEAGSVILENSSGEAGILEIVPHDSAEADGPVEIRIAVAGLTFRGGRSALSILPTIGSPIVAEIDECVFSGQQTRSIEASVEPGATLDLTVRGSLFRESGGGIGAETGAGAEADVRVEACRMETLRAWGPEGMLGAGVDLHLDPAARLRARIERSIFQGTASALQLTSAEASDDPVAPAGDLDVGFLGNLIVGSSPGAPGSSGTSTRSGLYLSLWPHHRTSLLVASNTFFGVDGPIVFHDNLPELLEGGEIVPWTFVNNIASRIAAESELDFELGGGELPAAEREKLVVRGNLLERSALAARGVDGNWTGEPGFVDPSKGDFRLAPGSPAIDRGLDEWSHVLRTDLDGNCRRAAAECRPGLASYPLDVGAYELPGFCDEELAIFRRGDCDGRGAGVEISDAVRIFGFLFLGGERPASPDACDSNDDGRLDITDGIFLLSYLFLGGEAPPPPFDAEGSDPTRDCLQPSA